MFSQNEIKSYIKSIIKNLAGINASLKIIASEMQKEKTFKMDGVDEPESHD